MSPLPDTAPSVPMDDRTPVQPIAVDDVVAYLLATVDRGTEGVYSVGSEPLTFKRMIQEFASVRGLRRLIVPVPVLAPELAAL